MSVLLAFDTATDRMAVVLGVGGRVYHHCGPAGAQASLTLLPSIFALLDAAHLKLADVDAIGFGRGPGAFTGLRTAASVAQGLAAGAGKPVLALDTLMAIADDARAEQRCASCWAAIDARMGEVYAAHYAHEGARWRTVDAPALYTIDALNALWTADAPHVVAGNACTAFAERLCFGGARLAAAASPSPRALITLARAAWDDRALIEPAQALPLYLRDKVALTSAERDAVKLARSGSGT